MPFRILVVDDNIRDKTDTISALPTLLEGVGYEVATTADGESAYDLVFEYKPDLVVLDIHFARRAIDGIEICRAIRTAGYQAPIILITAVFTETEDVVAGFEAGADDYVRKPCDNLEVLARIRANLPPGIEEIDDRIRVDFENQRVCIRRGEEWQDTSLPPLLFRLLQVLALNAGRIMESTRLKDRVWDRDDISDDALAVCIRRLREKLEPDPGHPTHIETVRGVGYRFNGRPAPARRATQPRRKTC
jgi:DNA-binding response OmpR family regulator